MKKIILPFLFVCSLTNAQVLLPNVTGNVETTFQYLNEDTLIGAQQPAEKTVLNSYALVNYDYKGFKAGLRIESYLPHILGYPDRFSGTGFSGTDGVTTTTSRYRTGDRHDPSMRLIANNWLS